MSSNIEHVNPSDKEKTSMSFNLGSQQLLSTNKQYTQADLFPRYHPMIPVMPVNVRANQPTLPLDENLSHGRIQTPASISNASYQLAFTSNELVQSGIQHNVQAPFLNYMGFQPSPLNRFPLEKATPINAQSVLPANTKGQVTASKKRPAQRERLPKNPTPLSVSAGSQLLPMQKRSTQMVPPPKDKTDSFDMVRSKLRESLAASLALASNQKNSPQSQLNNSPKETKSMQDQGNENKLGLAESNPSACDGSLEMVSDKDQVLKSESQDVPTTTDPTNPTDAGKPDLSEDQKKPIDLADEVQFSSNDELLQEYGLCWASEVEPPCSELALNHETKRPKLERQESVEGSKMLTEEVAEITENRSNQDPESLATNIEAELFRLFGGVNKKYKEKGRSLLFNLKDPNNPELRERVLSGDIAPERLCSMTAEELASKELSEWRIAKAEEFAQMKVLPDSDVDIRRLVRKTHKGEFQVEVENDDSVSVEVAIRADTLSYIPKKVNEGAQTQLKPNESQVSKSQEGYLLSEKANIGDQQDPNLENLLSEKADFMQDLMVDELKDTKCLPPIVSLDEFMEALDSEPPFENLSMENDQEIADATEKNSETLELEMKSELDRLAPKVETASAELLSKSESSEDKLGSKSNPSDSVLQGSALKTVEINTRETSTSNTTGSTDIKQESGLDNTSTLVSTDKVNDMHIKQESGLNNTGTDKVNDMHIKPDSCLMSSPIRVEADTSYPDIRSQTEQIWNGLIQLNTSAVCTVVGYFRSGEKTSTKDWPKFLEIKGRVRVDAFEKFLQELRLSRSRAIMVTQFSWKDGSDESGRLHLCETADSYVKDQRVGFAEPIPAVELYFCPPHPKTIEMLSKHLPQDHIKTLQSTNNSLIGVVVWRRPHVNTISPRMPSHHKHGSSKKSQFGSNRQHHNIANSKSSRSPKPQFHPGEEPIDDIPPGFGPASADDKDDLPEFDFGNSRPKSSAPVDKMRALIQKYGANESKSWKDDDDDMPEWQPHQEPPQQQQLPPPPLPQLPPQNQNYQQQVLQQPFVANQQFAPVPFQLMQQPPQQMLMPQPQMQMGMMPGQWWAPSGWGPAAGGMNMPIPMTGTIQPCNMGGQPTEAQFYAMPQQQQQPQAPMPQVQTGMGWRPRGL